jgi:hypothetical protein
MDLVLTRARSADPGVCWVILLKAAFTPVMWPSKKTALSLPEKNQLWSAEAARGPGGLG